MQGPDGPVLEQNGHERSIVDGEEVHVGGQLWRVFVGGDGDLFETQPTTPARDLRATRFIFTDAEDAGLARLSIVCDDGEVSISGRSLIVVLLHLARARLADREQAVNELHCGWRSRQDILGSLRISPEKLNLDLHRARRVLLAEGVRAVDALIERRREQGMLRIGPSNLTILPAPEPLADDPDLA